MQYYKAGWNISQINAAEEISNSPLKSKTEKRENVFDKKCKIAKRSHSYKRYASTCNVEILNSFHPELQVKHTEFAIENELIYQLSEVREFKFVTRLVLEFRNIESNDEAKYSIFYLNSKTRIILMKVILMMYLNQFILQLYQISKNISKWSGWIIGSVIIIILIFQITIP